eukprot:6208431-Pleurochrysis_carterae.AAC.2
MHARLWLAAQLRERCNRLRVEERGRRRREQRGGAVGVRRGRGRRERRGRRIRCLRTWRRRWQRRWQRRRVRAPIAVAIKLRVEQTHVNASLHTPRRRARPPFNLVGTAGRAARPTRHRRAHVHVIAHAAPTLAAVDARAKQRLCAVAAMVQPAPHLLALFGVTLMQCVDEHERLARRLRAPRRRRRLVVG